MLIRPDAVVTNVENSVVLYPTKGRARSNAVSGTILERMICISVLSLVGDCSAVDFILVQNQTIRERVGSVFRLLMMK